MNTTITVCHGTAFDGGPLCTIDGLPGEGADLRPEQMRSIAKALLQAADDCKASPIYRKQRLRVTRAYSLATDSPATHSQSAGSA